jgi:signal transduction histidine kinase
MEHWANLGMMVEGIAHQVRNPIVSIGGYTQRLHKSYPPSVKNKFYLDQILRETKKLEMMIQRMEEYILIPKPTFRKENFREVIENTIRSFSKEAMKKKISLHLETGTLEGNGSLFIDKDLMINALSQILKNSIETITQIPERKKETPIKVTLSGDKESVGVSISDQGEGISKKDLGHIFNPFFSTRPDRVGLGLTFAKRVVEQHRGRIRVESRLKRGTVVTVTLPRDRRKRIRRELIFPETDLFISF